MVHTQTGVRSLTRTPVTRLALPNVEVASGVTPAYCVTTVQSGQTAFTPAL